MKSKPTTAGSFVASVILSFVLIFMLLAASLCAAGTYFTHTDAPYMTQIEQQDAAQKVHDSLQSTFDAQVSQTAVESSVYMDVLTVDWIEDAMKTEVAAHIDNSGETIDYSALDDAITAYFEDFAQENNYTIDDAYNDKLQETISNAHSTVLSAVDVYHFTTMDSAGIWSKISKIAKILPIGVGVCAAIALVLVIILIAMRRRPLYWLCVSFGVAGLIEAVPTAIVLISRVIYQFAYKDPAVYAVCTGLFSYAVRVALIFGAAMLVIGVLCGIITTLTYKRRSAKIMDIDDTATGTPKEEKKEAEEHE